MALLTLPPRADHTAEGVVLSVAEGTARYAQLRREVLGAGILRRAYRFYALLISAIVIGMAVSLFFMARLPVSLALVGWSALFAFLAVQACGVVHDAGHRAILGTTRLNTALGEAFSFVLAMGFESWREQHNAHHAHTNVDGQDPDLAIPLHAFTLRQLERQRGVWRLAVRYQALLFYPMRTFVVVSRRLADIERFRNQRRSPALFGRIFLWAVGIVAWFAVPFLVFPLTKALLIFFVVHLLMGLYLSNIFAPNHKGMPQVERGTKISFLEQQIITSRNIRPGWLTDFIYMGLNYQIEHHLFPACPRNKLKQITPLVLAVCAETGIEFTEAGVVESNRIIIAELNRIAGYAGR